MMSPASGAPAGLAGNLFRAYEALAGKSEDVAGGTGLHQPKVPFLLANAVWHPAPDQLEEAADWCRAHGIPEAFVLPSSDAAGRARAREAGFLPRWAFELAPLPRNQVDLGTRVEQVSWLQARAAGRLFAARYRQHAFAPALAEAVAEALRRCLPLSLYLAYRDEEVVAALLLWHGPQRFEVLLEAGDLDSVHDRIHAEAETEGPTAGRWLARNPGGALPARGVIRFERPS